MIDFREFEAQLVVNLNHAFAAYPNMFILFDGASNNYFIRDLPILFAISFIWFQKRGNDRLKIILGLTGVCIATILSVIIQSKTTFFFRTRPLVDPSLDIMLSGFGKRDEWYSAPNSFPSDTATMYAALSLLIMYCRIRVGMLIAVWCILFIMLPRAIYGYHFPSDLIAGIAFGLSFVFLCMKLRNMDVVKKYSWMTLRYDALCSSLFVLFISEMHNLFSQIRIFGSLVLYTLLRR